MSQTTTPSGANLTDALESMMSDAQEGRRELAYIGAPKSKARERDLMVTAAVAAIIARNAELTKVAAEHRDGRLASLEKVAELEAERGANVKNVHRLMNGLNSIYAELERVAPWSQSNDMDDVDEIMCAIGLLAQDRVALAAENKALRDGVNGLKFDIYELTLPELREAFDGAKTICVVQMDTLKALREAMARTPATENDDG